MQQKKIKKKKNTAVPVKLVVIIIFVIVMIIMIIITIIIYLFTCWLWAKASHVESLLAPGESRIYNYRIPMNFPHLRLSLISFILGTNENTLDWVSVSWHNLTYFSIQYLTPNQPAIFLA